jgi:Protein of unknown function (DUF1588)/Protein of unknown function (DUF1592)/Protein of unknown function (DUF1595)/Protein of unknown function (DUF1587)
VRTLGFALTALATSQVWQGCASDQGTGGNGGSPGGMAGNTAGAGGDGAGRGGSGGSVGFMLDCPRPNLGSPTLRLFTRSEMESTLSDVFPEVRGQWTGSLPANTLGSYGFDNDGSAVVGAQLAGALVDTALAVATAVTGGVLATVLPCSVSAADRGCAEQFLTKYGRRLFRRPLTQAEHDRYLGFFDASNTKSDFKTALKWMAVGLIQSPNAVYRSEIGVPQSDGTRRLSPHELATALSYTYTGSTPSETLLARADNGDLGDILALARSLVATDSGKQVLQRFFEGYLGYTGASSIQRPGIATFSDVGSQMITETRAFVDDIILQHPGGMKQLLTAPTTNPSRALAAYYGFPAPPSDYASMARPTGRGLGILAQGSFLATHASADSSSPTRRGLFPFLRLLCETTSPPPPNVPQIAAPQPGAKTTRQRYEDVHAKMGSACNGCHSRWDPIGFGFEHFDEGGRYRQTEGGLTIDSSGTVTKSGSVLFSFSGQEDLVTGLANQPVIHQCMAAYLAAYAFGSGEACLGASQVSDLQSGAIGVAEAFVRLAAEPHFTRRDAR